MADGALAIAQELTGRLTLGEGTELLSPIASPQRVHAMQGADVDGPPIVWAPLAGSQELAMSCPAGEIFYEGTRGPGKTDVQLMKYRRYVGMGYGRFWRGVIFDREYKNLEDMISKSLRWFPQMQDGCRFLSSGADLKWVWPTGEELLFRQIKRFSDYWKYHGQEFPYIGWNELCKFATPDLYDMLKSCNRSSFRPEDYPIHLEGQSKPNFLPEIPLITFSTANPYGPGHGWVKRRFVDPVEPGHIIRAVSRVFNPRTQKHEDVTKMRVRIFGSYKENRYLSPEYVADLESITDENKRKAWLWGDWDIIAGGALSDLWGPHLILPRFQIPKGWYIDRSFDWGSSKPFSVGWWAESNGEEVRIQNKVIAFPKGTLIRFHEWYGSKEIGTNTGLRLSAHNVAAQIKIVESQLLRDRWISKLPEPGPADNSIGDVHDAGEKSIKSKMAEKGVVWKDSNKSPGSRKNGLQMIREMLEASLPEKRTEQRPGMYFMNHCRAAIGTLPILPRDEKDPDDVDTDAEDHAYDEIRYRALAKRQSLIARPL
jgi:hypothetical protein